MTSLVQIAEPAARLLKARGETVAVSESSCGGLISASLLSIPGSSAYFLGGATVYTRSARRGLLRFNDARVRMRGSTEEYALLCAKTIRDLLEADWAIAESGAAGPTGNRYGDPAGHVALAVSGPREATRILQTGSDDRQDNMWTFTKAAVELLCEAVGEAE